MKLNKSQLYTAFKAKDPRFDGRFFVGISSTGIYCRPVCRARQPKEENCTFYATAAEAEQAGYRPCLLCRPELAPGTSAADATKTLAKRAAIMLEQNCANAESLKEIAERLGCTDRHLRRVFMQQYNVSPVKYLQTCRLLLAKNLLTDTTLSILEVAMAAGFGSLRRFNHLFQKQYRLSPTALRRKARTDGLQKGNITLALGYRPPYMWDNMLDFLSLRAISGVETVTDGAYYRTVDILTAENHHFYGWIKVEHAPKQNVLKVTLCETLLPVLPQVLAKVRHLFDLYCEPETVAETLAGMNNTIPEVYRHGTRLPGCFDSFEMAVRAVLGQQITVKAAGTLAERMAKTFGRPLQTTVPGLTHTFPLAEDIAALENVEDSLGPLGIISARACTIKSLAEAVVGGEIDLTTTAQPALEIENLLRIKGIGRWTAQYIAMRGMGWPDAFLETDFGVKKALAPRTTKEMLELAENWRPWRSYATINLWNSL